MKWDHSLINTLEWGNQISHKEDKIKYREWQYDPRHMDGLYP